MRLLCMTLVALSGVTLAGQLPAAAPSPLHDLSAWLAHARRVSASDSPKATCPTHLERLRGVQRADIRLALGPPLAIDPDDDPDHATEWSYSARPFDYPAVLKDSDDGSINVMAGGGFPILDIAFDQHDRVTAARCYYAR